MIYDKEVATPRIAFDKKGKCEDDFLLLIFLLFKEQNGWPRTKPEYLFWLICELNIKK